MNNSEIKFVYFGGEPLGVPVLEELKQADLLPSLIVCNPDRPAGRGQKLTKPPVKLWAEAHDIPTLQPTDVSSPEAVPEIAQTSWDLFVVVAYNKILPTWLIELPTHTTINVHPSLLPKLRGASPIRSAILRNELESVGVTIMQMDAKMDHGPILAQMPMPIEAAQWPVAGNELDTALARQGGALLADTIPEWIQGTITPQEQNHEQATYCGRLSKDMAELTIDTSQPPQGEAAQSAFATIQAFKGIGEAWFMHDDIRYKVTKAHIANDTLHIERVIPAGKKEQDWHN